MDRAMIFVILFCFLSSSLHSAMAQSGGDLNQVCIIGAGIGGLTTAMETFRLTGERPVIFEKEGVLGGKIRTSYAGQQLAKREGGSSSSPCVDDPTGALAGSGMTCAGALASPLATAGCDTPNPSGAGTLGDLCPLTCEKCTPECVDDPDGTFASFTAGITCADALANHGYTCDMPNPVGGGTVGTYCPKSCASEGYCGSPTPPPPTLPVEHPCSETAGVAMRAGGTGLERPPDNDQCILGHGGTVPQELGACYTSPDYVRLGRLLGDLGLDSQTVTVPPRMVHTPSGDTLPLSVYTAEFLVKTTASLLPVECQKPDMDIVTCGRAAAAIVLQKLDEYFALHRSLFGEYGGGRPPMPSPTAGGMRAINGTYGDFLDRNGLTPLRPVLALYQTSQGYGDLDTLPAYYGLYWCTPLGLQLVKQQLGMQSESERDLDPKVLAPGFTEIIERLAVRSNADIRLNTAVVAVDRTKLGCRGGSGVSVFGGKSARPQWLADDDSCGFTTVTTADRNTFKCGHVLVNVPVTQVKESGLLDPMTTDEQDVLGDIGNCNEWQTFLFRAEDSGTLSAVDTWPHHFGALGKLVTTRFTPRILSEWSARQDAVPEEFVTLSLHSHGMNTSAVEANVRTELQAQGASGITKIDEFRASDYFCHFSGEGVQKGLPWAVDALQGRQKTYFVGGSVSFEALEPIISYAQRTVVPMLAESVGCGRDMCCRCRVECADVDQPLGTSRTDRIHTCFQNCLPEGGAKHCNMELTASRSWASSNVTSVVVICVVVTSGAYALVWVIFMSLSVRRAATMSQGESSRTSTETPARMQMTSLNDPDQTTPRPGSSSLNPLWSSP